MYLGLTKEWTLFAPSDTAILKIIGQYEGPDPFMEDDEFRLSALHDMIVQRAENIYLLDNDENTNATLTTQNGNQLIINRNEGEIRHNFYDIRF